MVRPRLRSVLRSVLEEAFLQTVERHTAKVEKEEDEEEDDDGFRNG